jgi:hypothetical protein
MLADTSDIHALSAAQRRHAADLTAVAADLAAAQVPTDAFGSVGAGFLAALNDALALEAHRAGRLAERLGTATSTAGSAASAYSAAEFGAGRAISAVGV